MNGQALQKLSPHLCMALLGCVLGCSTGKAPTEPPGRNPITNGSVTWYVDAVNGSTFGDGTTPQTAFNTIQQGANIALPGDTVLVADGTYQNSGAPTLDVKTPGTADAYITYTAAPGAHPVITGDKTYDIVQFETTAQYIVFEGFTVIGDNAEITLAQAQKYEGEPGEYPEYNGNCINATADQSAANQPHHIKILNNIVENCSGAGIGGSADYFTISGNTIYNSAWYNAYGESAIDIYGTYDTNPSDTTTPYKVMITDNFLYGNQEFIPWVKEQKITDGEGIIIDSNYNQAYDPTLGYPSYSGRTLIANNVLYQNGSSAIEVFESAHVDIVNNSTYGNDISSAEPNRGEIGIGNLNDVNVYNNILYSPSGGNPLVLGTACSTCKIDYNLYYGGPVNITGGAMGPHDITADPLYVAPTASAPANVSLKLSPGSPAIGAGTTMLAPPTDIDGNPRPITPGAAVTMGAYSQ